MANWIFELDEISKRFVGIRSLRPPFSRLPDVLALNGVTCSIASGGITAIVGENGSGKSTLLRILAGILTATTGSIRATCERAAYVNSQDKQFYERLTGYENLRFFARLQGAQNSRVRDAAGEAGLSNEQIERQVWTYSAGQKRRLAVARAFLDEADAYLFDEPTRSIDEAGAALVWERFRGLANGGRCVIVATHDAQLANRCDSVVELRRGRVSFAGSPSSWQRQTLSSSASDR